MKALLRFIIEWVRNFYSAVSVLKAVLLTALSLLVLALLVLSLNDYLETIWVWNVEPDRGAVAIQQDLYGDGVSKVVYLDQGWNERDSLWFYTTTQGSDLLPYDFFLALEQPENSEPFASNENMNRYRFLVQRSTTGNPDALPVGFVKDTYKNKEYLGFTCAACHTGQVNYQGTGIRIDGGPAGSDINSFLRDLGKALEKADEDSAANKRFIEKVSARGHYDTEDIRGALKKYKIRLRIYNTINETKPLEYGYARLDAFGRIYNRVLEHVLTKAVVKHVLLEHLPSDEAGRIDEILGSVADGPLNEADRDRVIATILSSTGEHATTIMAALFNSPDAPVSYPFLWDIPHHDYVQWNGLAANADAGPIGRNAGEVVGVFGTLDWSECTINWSQDLIGTLACLSTWPSSVLTKQGFKAKRVNFDSSINVHNLRRIENHLKSLQSPQWPKEILNQSQSESGKESAKGKEHCSNRKTPGDLDEECVKKGDELFADYCAGCHAEIIRDDKERRVVAHMTRLGDIGTDPLMAENSVAYSGMSGILRNLYADTAVGGVLLNERAPAAALLTKATAGVVATPYPSGTIFKYVRWIYDLGYQLLTAEIKPSVKQGEYDPDTSAKPLASLLAYKGRSLNGIWATAPYLHNGSVPSLYDLLLPSGKNTCKQAIGSVRPNVFQTGSREFDPKKVGFKSDGYSGFRFDTSLPGNSNAGHEYGTPCGSPIVGPDGKDKHLPPLTEDQRWELVEYLKSL